MDEQEIKQILLEFDNVKQYYPFKEGLAVFKIVNNDKDDMFAILEEGKIPVNLSLRCDYRLSKLLREKYETVMPGNNLSKNKWNTIILTGQLPDNEIKDLIVHAYQLVKKEIED